MKIFKEDIAITIIINDLTKKEFKILYISSLKIMAQIYSHNLVLF